MSHIAGSVHVGGRGGGQVSDTRCTCLTCDKRLSESNRLLIPFTVRIGVLRSVQAMTRSALGTEENVTRSYSPMYSPSTWKATGRVAEISRTGSSCRLS